MNCRQSYLVVSIDLEPRTNTASLQHQREVRNAGADIMRLFDKYRVPATCAVVSPGRDAKTDNILASSVPHELAIQGDAVWFDSTIDRSALAGHLTESAVRAAELDVSVHSLVGVNIDSAHTDLLVKNSITALRSTRSTGRSVRWTQPMQIRFSVWDIPESFRFPGVKSWLGDIATVSVERSVKSAAARNRPLHLVVDAERVAESKSTHLATLENVLACAGKYRSLKQLKTATMSESIREMTTRPVAKSANSILRAA